MGRDTGCKIRRYPRQLYCNPETQKTLWAFIWLDRMLTCGWVRGKGVSSSNPALWITWSWQYSLLPWRQFSAYDQEPGFFLNHMQKILKSRLYSLDYRKYAGKGLPLQSSFPLQADSVFWNEHLPRVKFAHNAQNTLAGFRIVSKRPLIRT